MRALLDQPFEVPTKRTHVLHEVRQRLLERHKYGIFLIVSHAGEQKLLRPLGIPPFAI